MRRCRRNRRAKGATLTFMCGGDDKAFGRGQAGAGEHGQEDRCIARRRCGSGREICNNMILAVSMIGSARVLHSPKSSPVAFRRCSTSLDLVGAVLGADDLLPGAGPGADLAANNGYKPASPPA